MAAAVAAAAQRVLVFSCSLQAVRITCCHDLALATLVYCCSTSPVWHAAQTPGCDNSCTQVTPLHHQQCSNHGQQLPKQKQQQQRCITISPVHCSCAQCVWHTANNPAGAGYAPARSGIRRPIAANSCRLLGHPTARCLGHQQHATLKGTTSDNILIQITVSTNAP